MISVLRKGMLAEIPRISRIARRYVEFWGASSIRGARMLEISKPLVGRPWNAKNPLKYISNRSVRRSWGCRNIVVLVFPLWATLLVINPVFAAGGYFILGYGPQANQQAGTSTAIGMDAFSGASNPAKLSAVSDRFDVGGVLFMPYRRVTRSGSDSIYDFSTTSNNSFFLLPEAGYVQQITERWSWGISLYGNGGLNTEYRGTTGVPDSNANPDRCGEAPGNFLLGCGKLGFDLRQVIIAPTLSWQFSPNHSLGIAPLLSYQTISIYGFQALEGFSNAPDYVTNNGRDGAFGGGVRIGWYGRLTPWLDAGAAYSTRVYSQRFRKYRGILADRGSFDIPGNFSVGAAVRILPEWTIGFDVQRILYGSINALNNDVTASLQDPDNRALGSADGSGFNWRDQTNYRLGITYDVNLHLSLRVGYAYGQRPQANTEIESVTLNMFAPNPVHNGSIGFSWAISDVNAFHFAYSSYISGTYEGPSATADLGVGGNEKVKGNVNQVWLGWGRRL